MKKTILTILSFLVFSTISYSQTITFGVCKASKAIIDGEDVTQLYVDNAAYIIFYQKEIDDRIIMANKWENQNSQSYGPLIDIEFKGKHKAAGNKSSAVFKGFWQYYNSNDDKSGVASVEMIFVYEDSELNLTILITPPDSKTIVFSGDYNGTVPFEKNN